MTLYSWVRNREIGLRNSLGDLDSIHKRVYQSIQPDQTHLPWDGPETTSDYGGVFNLEFSLDGSLLVAACEKKAIMLFDPTTAAPFKVIDKAHHDCVNCIKFVDDRIFATCSDDSTVAIWDIRNLKTKLKSLHGHSNWVKNIEYIKKDNLLVTSGFDGSIFTWDINSTTENGFVYRKVFHTTGLMRCRISPDENRLVICTTGGYIIVIHNLDLTTLGSDLNGFRPNVYRLMQMGRQYLPVVANYENMFKDTKRRNRLEFITDFPEGNNAEVVSSLQIHPQGWCCLSRNISYDESSEWSCIHDIQEMEPLKEEDDNESENNQNEQSQMKVDSSDSNSENTTNETETNSDPNSNNVVDMPIQNNFRSSSLRSFPDLWAAEISWLNRDQRQNLRHNVTAFDASQVHGISSGVIRQSHPIILPTESYKYHKINENRPRLIYYTQEPNMGKGFIKELCFSSDGRIICSPHGKGVRLLAFNKKCAELPYTLNADNDPQELHVIKLITCHSDIVVSTKFSPTHPLLVSGCLSGKVVWYYPVM